MPYDWIVDPGARRVEAMRLGGGAYEAAGALDETTSTALPPLTELTLDPNAIWR